MNKKLLVVSILAVFMLVAISFASAVSTQTASATKKESPLFRIRTRKAIGERLDELKEAIRAKFIGERAFLLPFQWLRNKIHDDSMASIIYPTCYGNWCTYEKTFCQPYC